MRTRGGRKEEWLPQHRHHRAGQGVAPDLGGGALADSGLAGQAAPALAGDRLHSTGGLLVVQIERLWANGIWPRQTRASRLRFSMRWCNSVAMVFWPARCSCLG